MLPRHDACRDIGTDAIKGLEAALDGWSTLLTRGDARDGEELEYLDKARLLEIDAEEEDLKQ